jgi:hypothetical protein
MALGSVSCTLSDTKASMLESNILDSLVLKALMSATGVHCNCDLVTEDDIAGFRACESPALKYKIAIQLQNVQRPVVAIMMILHTLRNQQLDNSYDSKGCP